MTNIKINAEKCKGCGLCMSACKFGLLSFSGEINSSGYHYAMITQPERCTGCQNCCIICPDLAITIGR